MEIDTKKIGDFLKRIDGAEYIYLQRCMELRNAIEQLIKRHNLSKQDVCARFQIKPVRYSDFVKGNYNYNVKDMANLNAAFIELEMRKLKDEVPVKIAENKEK